MSEDIIHLRNLLQRSMEEELKVYAKLAEVERNFGVVTAALVEQGGKCAGALKALRTVQGYVIQHPKGMDDFEVEVLSDIVRTALADLSEA